MSFNIIFTAFTPIELRSKDLENTLMQIQKQHQSLDFGKILSIVIS